MSDRIVRHFQTPSSRRVDEIFAWLAVDTDGSEGIAGAEIGSAGMIPLVGGDRARMDSLRPYAERVHRLTGLRIKLVRFTAREELDSIGRADA